MLRLCTIALAGALAGCASTASSPAAPWPPPQPSPPAPDATLGPRPPPVEVALVDAIRAHPVTRAVRVEGISRFDHVALLEAGLLCGTRAGQAPVCATDPEFMDHGAFYEKMQDVAVLEALGGLHCVLHGTGVLRCRSGMGWPVFARDVAEFAISSPAGASDVLYTLGRDGTVRRFVPVKRTPGEVLATDALDLASLGAGGACAVLAKGRLVCSDVTGADSALEPTRITDARAVFYGGAVLRTDGTWTFASEEAAAMYAPRPRPATDYAFQAQCLLEPGGSISCRGLGADWLDVELPAPARRFTPRGYALCAELVDDTTACWGPFLDELIRLGARRPPAAATDLAR